MGGGTGAFSPARRFVRDQAPHSPYSPSKPNAMSHGSPGSIIILPQISHSGATSPVRTSLESVPAQQASPSAPVRAMPLIRLNAWNDPKNDPSIDNTQQPGQLHVPGNPWGQSPERAHVSRVMDGSSAHAGTTAAFPQLPAAPHFPLSTSGADEIAEDSAAKIEQLRQQYQQYRAQWLASYKGSPR